MRQFIRELSNQAGLLGFFVTWLRFFKSLGAKKATEYAWNSHGFDIYHRVDTSHVAVESHLWSGGDETIADMEYAVTSTPARISRAESAFAAAEKHLEFEKTKFFDLGCGKGRVLLIA